MINREATIRWKGYDPNDLSPKSSKRVWANCDICGRGRWVYKCAYRSLCPKCAANQPEKIEKLRNAAVEQWNVPGARELLIESKKQALINDPSISKRQGKSLKKFYMENPDKLEEMKERNKEIFNTEERKKESLDRILDWRKNNPKDYEKSLENSRIAHQKSEFKEKQRINRLKQTVMPTDGTSIELKMRKILEDNNYQFKTNIPLLNLCIPDIVFISEKVIIQCDGDYWHNYPDGTDKDRNQDKILLENGWTVIRFWEHEINNDIEMCLHKFELEYHRGD